jgi:hypothetical protein
MNVFEKKSLRCCLKVRDKLRVDRLLIFVITTQWLPVHIYIKVGVLQIVREPVRICRHCAFTYRLFHKPGKQHSIS